MPDLLKQLERYLRETVDVSLEPRNPKPWKKAQGLPFYLRDRYEFLEARFLTIKCLFMMDAADQDESPARIRKHIDQVQGKWDGPVVYVRRDVTTYNRKRLIEHKVPFVVPGNQLYLPMLAIDLREHYRGRKPEQSKLAPSAQAVLIYALGGPSETLTPTELASALGYSVMSMSRAMDELEAAQLGESLTVGRERCLRLTRPRREVWDAALPFLRSPVMSRHTIEMTPDLPQGFRAGLSALSEYSMVAAPRNHVIALGRSEWRKFKDRHAVTLLPVDVPGALEVEVWHYAPALFGRSGIVDRVSLYLSLRGTHDERVEAALEEMMRELSW